MCNVRRIFQILKRDSYESRRNIIENFMTDSNFIIITLEYAKMQKKKYVLHDDNHTVHVVYRCTDLT